MRKINFKINYLSCDKSNNYINTKKIFFVSYIKLSLYWLFSLKKMPVMIENASRELPP